MGYNIAVLGFGNLPNQLYNSENNESLLVKKAQIQTSLMTNSNLKEGSLFIPSNLELPLRLGHISQPNTHHKHVKVTLCQGASNEAVFVAQSKLNNLNDAINNLQNVEGISKYKDVGYVNLKQNTSRAKIPEVANKIKQWALENGFDAVVWNDLNPNIPFAANSKGREVEAMLARDPTLLRNTQQYLKIAAGKRNNLQERILAAHVNHDLDISAYKASLTADFDERAKPENQTSKPKSQWYATVSPNEWNWGPSAAKYPKPQIPEGVNKVQWQRDRVIAAALYWVNKGVPYSSKTASQFGLTLPNHIQPSFKLRGHFPARNCGLDCSNFAAWVFNFALGKQFSSDVGEQIGQGFHSVGRRVQDNESLQKGDLLYFDGNVKHVVIYMDENHVIESTSNGQGRARVVDIRQPQYAYLRPERSNPKFLFGRRTIE